MSPGVNEPRIEPRAPQACGVGPGVIRQGQAREVSRVNWESGTTGVPGDQLARTKNRIHGSMGLGLDPWILRTIDRKLKRLGKGSRPGSYPKYEGTRSKHCVQHADGQRVGGSGSNSVAKISKLCV